MGTYFVAGIDTDVGKTVVTGLLARYLKSLGKSVTTQKLAQTGNDDISEDIQTHRKLMNVKLDQFDKDRVTCPYVFSFPASPHLAARMENVTIDPATIDRSTQVLNENFDELLIEGVGGLTVPLTENFTTLDFLEKRKYPVVLVTSPKLGSINHTLLTLEVLKNREIPLKGVVYNWYPEEKSEIAKESLSYFKKYLKENFNSSNISECKKIHSSSGEDINFSEIFG